MKKNRRIFATVFASLTSLAFIPALAQSNEIATCKDVLNAINANTTLPDKPFHSVYHALKAAADIAIVDVKGAGIGLQRDMWATINDRDGRICAVVFTGENRGSQWPGSRNISAEKAYTANAYSLPDLAVSTANLFSANLPGKVNDGGANIGGFMGLQFSNLMNPEVAYSKNKTKKYGTKKDPMVGKILGGHIIFGGGFGLYSDSNTIVGGLGASGDTACYDNSFAWIIRDQLGLDHAPNPDNLIYDDGPGGNNNGVLDGFEHVDCGFGEKTFVNDLPTNYPLN